METYIDFAIALKKAGYDTDASRFLNLANRLFENGGWPIIEKNGEIGALTVNAAIDYLIYKQDWKKAEQLTEKLKEDHKIGQYQTFANRKMGLSFNDIFHENRMEAFQFNEASIINAKLCRLYNHCKK